MAALTEEQGLIRDQAKSWATEQSPVTKFRKLRDEQVPNAYWPDAWQAMIDMGWTGILVPEAHGGSDLGYLTFGLILEELGRQLTASPLLASALVGASALRLGGTDAQQAEYLPKIVDGSAVFSLAVDEGPRHAPEGIALRAEKDGNGFKLTGDKGFVLEGGAATHLVVAARTGGSPGERAGLTLFVVPASASGVSRSALSTVDSRGYANVTFDGVSVGGDAVLGLPAWHRWPRLLELAHLVVIARPGWQIPDDGEVAPLLRERAISPAQLLESPAGGILQCSLTPQDISATAVRALLQSGLDTADYLPHAVAGYIAEHGLYAQGEKAPSQR